jgi:methylated-DNA-protein-cysteine methyltransferase-like protein
MHKAKKQSFFNDVYEVVKCIPAGRVSTYGAIAHYLGLRSGARMVGWALNHAVALPEVPAHRVVNRHGMLTGKRYFGSPDRMAELLRQEGIQVENDCVQDFENIFWDPAKELNI